MTQTVTVPLPEQLEIKQKIKLTIPLVASYLARGVKRTKIAQICNLSNSSVYEYCERHYDKLAPLIDKDNGIAAAKAKHVANYAQDRLLLHLSETEKKDLFALNAISGTHIDKYRLLSDKSTQNVAIKAVRAGISDADAEIRALNKDLYGSEMGKGSDK